MRRYKWLTLSLVIIFSFVAFLPVIAFPWNETIDWQWLASAYENVKVFLPLILK